MTVSRPKLGRQLTAARSLAGITQEELAKRAGLHVNSIRYIERQEPITTGHSSEAVATVLSGLGVIFFNVPTPGVRLRPDLEDFAA